MNTAKVIASAVLALIVAFAAAPQAQADRGRFNVKNCVDQAVKICLYDWGDTERDAARQRFNVAAGKTDQGSCRRKQADLGKRYSGSYTILATGKRLSDGRDVWLNSGFAEDCSDPDLFVLTGSTVSGCTPEMTIYGRTDKSADGYKLQNFAMADMTRFLQDNGDMDNWVRALKVSSGKWQICEHAYYGGKCLAFRGSTWDVRLDTDWNGNWDRKISSIRPLSCN